jgi:hypothetical protein
MSIRKAVRAVTVPGLCLISHASLAAADLFVVNGDIYTVDPDRGRAEALAVEDGRFTAVGSNAEVRRLADSATRLVDARGHTVIPGLIDSHSHVSGNSPLVAGVDLSYVASKGGWLRLIEEADQRLPGGE